jgi:hypothetical protein
VAGPTVAPLVSSQFPESICNFEWMGRLIDEAVAALLLTTCSWESAESTYGACDGVPCRSQATVYDTQTERDYCAKHFREVNRG